MAKKKNTLDEMEMFTSEICSFLKTSADVDVEDLGARDQIPFFIDSGSYSLNWIISNDMLNGGVPGTKVVMVAGESEKGKSLITDIWLGNFIRNNGVGFRMDVEDGSGHAFAAKVIGSEEIAGKINIISPKKLSGAQYKKAKEHPEKLLITIERFASIINKLVDFQLSKNESDRKPILLVVDSVSNLTSAKEIQDIKAENDKRDMTSQQKMRGMFRSVTQMLRSANITLVGIAHLTANIGVMFGEKMVVNAKGSAFGYNSSLTLQMISSKELLDKKTKIPIGIRMKLKTKKNRVKFKGREAFLSLFFEKGIDRFSGLSELLNQYGLAIALAARQAKKTDDESDEKKPVKGIKPNSDGSFDPTQKIQYVCLDGTVLEWRVMEMAKVLEATGRPLEIIQEMNDRLNEVYDNVLKNQGIFDEDEAVNESDDEDDLFDLDNVEESK